MINCIYFNRTKFKNKEKIKQWLRKNKKKMDFDIYQFIYTVYDKKTIIKNDKDYFIKIRPIYKFNKTSKNHLDGAKLIKGFLK